MTTNLKEPVEPVQFSDTLSLTYDTWLFFIVLSLLFVVIVITIVGNGLVFAALIRFSRLRSMSNVLIGNLALSDFLLAITILPLSAVNDATGHWLFGAILCDIWLAIDVFYCTASVWGLVAIAFDRFTATAFPIWYRGNQNQVRVLTYIVIVWILSGLICLPGLLGWGSKPIEDVTNASTNLTWAYEVIKLSTKTHVYDPHTGRYDCVLFTEPHYVVYSAMGSFIIPLIIMIGLYLKIFVVLRARGRILRHNQRVREYPTRNGRDNMVEMAESIGYDTNYPVCVNEMSTTDSPIRDESTVTTTTIRPTRCCLWFSRFDPTPRPHSVTVLPPTATSTQSTRTGLTPEDESKVPGDNLSEQSDQRSPDDPWIRDPFGQLSYQKQTTACFQNSCDIVPNLVVCPPSPMVAIDAKLTSQEDEEEEQLDDSEENATQGQNQSSTEANSIQLIEDDALTNGQKQISNGRAHTNKAKHEEQIVAESDSNSFPPNSNNIIDISNQQEYCRCSRSSNRINTDQNPEGFTQSGITTDLCEPRGMTDTRKRITKRGSAGTTVSSRERELARADYRERRATKRMGLIICIFILCWIPFTLMYLVRGLCGEQDCPDMPHLRMFVTWLGYANSALNPILYAVFNEQFRQAFAVLLRCTRGQKSMQWNSH